MPGDEDLPPLTDATAVLFDEHGDAYDVIEYYRCEAGYLHEETYGEHDCIHNYLESWERP